MDIMNYLKEELKDFTWYTKTISIDSTGQQTSTLTLQGSDKGDLQPVTETVIRAEAGQDIRTTNILYSNTNLDIKAGDVIEIEGAQYTVKEVKNYGTHKEIRLYART